MHPRWDTAFLEQNLPRGAFGRPLEFRSATGSTNTLALELARNGAAPGTLVLAETQTAGRGRRENRWHSPAGAGIWMSLLVPVPDMPYGDRLCNMACAVAVTDTLRESAGVDAAIKWPNDIWIGQRKICGILIEAVPGRKIFVAGMGINVNTQPDEFPDELKTVATSLAMEAEHSCSREELLLNILMRFSGLHEQIKNGDSDAIVKAYAERSFLIGRNVMAGAVTGIADGIRNDGALLIRTADGSVIPVIEGEVRF